MSIKQHEPNESTSHNQQKAAIKRFNEITKKLQQLFNLDPIDQYHQIQWLTIPIELNNPRFGCSESIGANNQLVLQISDEFLTKHNSLIDSVLWRENFLLYLPQRVRLVPEAADLGLYCYHKYGIKTRRSKQRFQQIWSTVSPPQGTLYYRYNPVHGFHYFDNVVDGTFLQKAIKWLRPFSDIPGPMSSETYIANLERWMFNYHRRLKPLELRVLRGLNNCLDCSQTKLAQRLELRQPTVSRVIRTLAEKHLMRLVTIENYPILGLQPIVVDFSIENISVITKLSKLLVRVQYLLGLQEFDNHLLVYFVIPNRRILRFRRWVKQLVSLLDLSPPKSGQLLKKHISEILIFMMQKTVFGPLITNLSLKMLFD